MGNHCDSNIDRVDAEVAPWVENPEGEEQHSASEMVRMKAQDKKSGEMLKLEEVCENTLPVNALSFTNVTLECTSHLESTNTSKNQQDQDCVSRVVPTMASNMDLRKSKIMKSDSCEQNLLKTTSGDMCPSVTIRPSSSQSGLAADQRREAFSRDVSPSLQSDTGSHGSSVDSYLEARRPDPEEVLLGLGFGGPLHNTEAEVSRIPARFLQQSKVKGVAIDDFLRYQQDLIETFESGYSGYRGLTDIFLIVVYRGAQIPSVIVAKIMEKLREHERESSIKSSAGSSPGQHAEISKRRFSRAAQRVTILTKMKSRDSIASGTQAHSVLNPDNRKFLDNQGSKSPESSNRHNVIGFEEEDDYRTTFFYL
ncbi:hypothetical protein FOCC_FOCC012130 [Frankliniella occidentalis]|nr:hypothetical protein FOCC_FOCC012130 [Frankliniella occidentalis]